MTMKKWLDSLAGSAGNSLFTFLYGSGSEDQERQRYLSLFDGLSPKDGFPGFSDASDLRIFTAPGRTELGGNHTDHNQGLVLAASIQMDAVAVVLPRTDRKVFFRSAGFGEVLVDLADKNGKPDLSPKPEEEGTTESLVRGIAHAFASRGVDVQGFSANVSSTVLQGSGLSSSATIEVLIAKIIDSLYAQGRRGALELAQISQQAENTFFGKPCGLMDQSASAFGGVVAIDFGDPALPQVQKIAFDPLAAGFALCVVNTRGNHSDLTPDYAAIPHEMSAVAKFFGKSFLRQIDLDQVLSSASSIRKAAGDRALLRAIHFFNENRRALSMAELLQKLNAAADQAQKKELMAQFLELVNESGDSSRELLQNIYSPRNSGEQEIALALAMSKEFLRRHASGGACRVHGGGFAGTIQAYIPVGALESYRSEMDALFGAGAVTVLRIRPVGAVELALVGAEITMS
jgi:galactokinase